MLSLAEIAERHARIDPQGQALLAADRNLTHRELAERSRRFAAMLRGLGLRRTDRFSVLSMNNAEFLVAYYAASYGGFILNTVNFRLVGPEIAWILQDAGPRILIFEAQYAETVAGLRAQLPSVEHYVCLGSAAETPDWAAHYETLIDTAEPEAVIDGGIDDVFCLMYTSGTTGKPKGVLHANRSMACNSESLSSELCLDPTTRLLAIAPLFHMGATTLALAALFRGGCVVLHRAFDAGEVIRTIEAQRVTAMHMVPTMVQTVLDAPEFGQHDLSSMRMLMYAAAPMPLPVLERAVAAFGPILYNSYGQTEINGLTFLRPHQHFLTGSADQVRRLSSVGQPHWQAQIRVVDDEGRDLPRGAVGEVVARSYTSMTSYWNNTPATLATLRDSWIFTGDVGYLDDEDYLFLVDRKKDVIISGGENIYSREVEDAVAAHPDVHECAVIGVPDVRWGESVKAVVVLRPGTVADAEALIAWTKGRIASYKAPKTIDFVAQLPRLPTGKISKLELRKQFAAQ